MLSRARKQAVTPDFLLEFEARSLQRAPSAVKRNRILIAHLLQIVRHERGTKTATAVKHESRVLIGVLCFDVALDDALTHMHGTLDVTGGEFVILARIDKNMLFAARQHLFVAVDVRFANA